jgi:hypothetical protein
LRPKPQLSEPTETSQEPTCDTQVIEGALTPVIDIRAEAR